MKFSTRKCFRSTTFQNFCILGQPKLGIKYITNKEQEATSSLSFPVSWVQKFTHSVGRFLPQFFRQIFQTSSFISKWPNIVVALLSRSQSRLICHTCLIFPEKYPDWLNWWSVTISSLNSLVLSVHPHAKVLYFQ